jgi:hypothetical protein
MAFKKNSRLQNYVGNQWMPPVGRIGTTVLMVCGVSAATLLASHSFASEDTDTATQFDKLEAKYVGVSDNERYKQIRQMVVALVPSDLAGRSKLAISMGTRGADKKKSHELRMQYLDTVRRQHLEKLVDSETLGKLKTVLDDDTENVGLRIWAGSVVGASAKHEDPSVREDIKKNGFTFVSDPMFGGAAIQELLSSEYDDQDVRKFVAAQLDRVGSDPQILQAKNASLVCIDKNFDKSQTQHIMELLDNKKMLGSFANERALYALADLGGDDVASYLILKYNVEKDFMNKLTLLTTIGATRSKVAKNFLTANLKDIGNSGYFTGVIMGLEYLGDLSTIPALDEFQTSNHLSKERLQRVATAIERIRHGGILAPGITRN